MFTGPGTQSDVIKEDQNRLKELHMQYHINVNDIEELGLMKLNVLAQSNFSVRGMSVVQMTILLALQGQQQSPLYLRKRNAIILKRVRGLRGRLMIEGYIGHFN